MEIIHFSDNKSKSDKCSSTATYTLYISKLFFTSALYLLSKNKSYRGLKIFRFELETSVYYIFYYLQSSRSEVPAAVVLQ